MTAVNKLCVLWQPLVLLKVQNRTFEIYIAPDHITKQIYTDVLGRQRVICPWFSYNCPRPTASVINLAIPLHISQYLYNISVQAFSNHKIDHTSGAAQTRFSAVPTEMTEGCSRSDHGTI